MSAPGVAEGAGLETAIALLLAAAMATGGGLNLAGPDFIRQEFRRWGYPAPLRVVVGLAECVSAALLLIPPTRPPGALLALGVLAGVLVTLARDRAWLRCEYPTLLAILAVLILTS